MGVYGGGGQDWTLAPSWAKNIINL